MQGRQAALQSLEVPLSWVGAGLVRGNLGWLSGSLSPENEQSMELGQISCLSGGWAAGLRMSQVWGSLGVGPGPCWLQA